MGGVKGNPKGNRPFCVPLTPIPQNDSFIIIFFGGGLAPLLISYGDTCGIVIEADPKSLWRTFSLSFRSRAIKRVKGLVIATMDDIQHSGMVYPGFNRASSIPMASKWILFIHVSFGVVSWNPAGHKR